VILAALLILNAEMHNSSVLCIKHTSLALIYTFINCFIMSLYECSILKVFSKHCNF